ncbi:MULTISPECIES: ShlB/FhaC/HecB family hemolysin secretion/activation protein [unclassified Variovorax]|uniref:ShlB/FhaC/HecB family hemolysin secretion/activation protein n=1 Tax=unclassified Variovorax TaxID=663243 RepID=UPI00076DCEC9|nr:MULTISPECIES: ShlB/FhaC/HecB family hemolysin secretion/activation protein [unclassified Variovorax]KWT96673.1 Hemolysin activator protein precursor [Variovorax sp. WDL1]PNG51929.1 Hemolysin transporter protein ShlB [Variovorax sp. B2]PNG54276.1 Hemolysin transporter protein ShlB [Variovorax sp. B4]VTV11764.1 Hemolysin transporter protein ShlB precursor [Variovorax sp. WDL1]
MIALPAVLAALAHAQAAPLPAAPHPFVEEQRQQERERALRRQQERAFHAPPRPEPRPEDRRLPEDESSCLRIQRVVLDGERAEDFQWALAAAAGADGSDDPRGRCLGSEGIDIVMARLQQAVVARGYVTTRVLASAQQLGRGTLAFTLIPGRIAAIRFAEGGEALASLAAAIPAGRGELINVGDIEQGLENLKRVPTAEADIQIEPSTAAGVRPGDSDLVVKYAQRFPLRTTLSLDDSGTQATGKTQAGATFAWDNPLGLNDLLYVSLSHDAFNHPGQGTSGQTVHYSLPWGYWLASATASQGRYHQTVHGADQAYVYAGESANAELRLSRLVYRDQRRKITLALRGFRRSAHNFLEDTEIPVQRRATAGWELGLAHREFIGEATLDATLAGRRGTGAFGALPAPEEQFGDGTSRFRIATAELGVNAPFQLRAQKLRYAGLWRAQWSPSALTSQDRFSIGGRYSVRGFDGESSLMGERGWLLRNDIGWALGASGAELYLGIDHGQVGGPSTRQLEGRQLSGGVIGLRGAWKGLSYDFFVGAPIAKPEGFRTATTAAGFNLNYSF